MKKSNCKIMLLILLMLMLSTALFGCQGSNPPAELNVVYSSTEGGRILGTTSQTVAYGEDATSVTVITNFGYSFVKWSDGLTAHVRTDKNITTAINVTAEFEVYQIPQPTHHTVTYSAGTGGRVSGDANQKVIDGGDATSVTAEHYGGFGFVRWSDGNTNAIRQDINITSAINITAEFVTVARLYNYNYNDATANNAQESISLKYGELQSVSFNVPKRDGFVFNGWYLEWYCATQVADEQGRIAIGNKIFDNKSNQLYAKWTAVEEIKYKILMVFVTEASANLTTTYGEIISVNYKMSETERRICELMPAMLGQYLTATLNGAVTFEVDAYFTKVAVGTKSFQHGTTTWPGSSEIQWDYKMFAYDIPEVSDSGMLDDYKSVITTFGMNDYRGKLRVAAGSAGRKYASIHLESLLGGYVINNQPIEWILDFERQYTASTWEWFMEMFLHEFTHTVELALWEEPEYQHVLDFHGFLSHYSKTVEPLSDYIKVTKLFLQNRADVNGVMAGIPFWFWKT